MLRKISLYNRFFVALLFIVSSICSVLISPLAYATPGYDDDLNLTSSLQIAKNDYFGLTCSSINTTTTWMEHVFNDSYSFYDHTGVDQSTGHRDAEQVSFRTALNNADIGGSWAVFSRRHVETPGVYGSNYSEGFVVLWNETEPLEVEWDVDGGVRIANSDGGLSVDYNRGFNGGQSCNPLIGNQGAGTTLVSSDAALYPKLFLTANVLPNYPTGTYGGNLIPVNVQGGLITGNIQCTTYDGISSAVVNVQSGVDGEAILTDDGVGGKNYRFYLSQDSPYSLIVLCDEDPDPFYGPTVDVNLYNSYNWACAVTGEYINECAAA